MAEYLNLVISAKSKVWRVDDKNFSITGNSGWAITRTAILKRDDYTCRFCGFHSKSYQEVHHLDDDHNNDASENLVTACSFCHQVHHIGLAGISGSAKLAWMPELTHQEINHLMRSKFVLSYWLKRRDQNTRSDDLSMLRSAESAFDGMVKARCDKVRVEMGTDSPISLGNAIINAPNQGRLERQIRLMGIRLVPTGTIFRDGEDVLPKMIESWLTPSGAYAGMQPSAWAEHLGQHLDHLRDF